MPLIEGLVGVDLTTVNTEYPVLARGIYPFIIRNPTQKKSQGGTQMLEFQLELQAEGKDVKGNPVPPGYIVHDTKMLAPTGKMTMQQVLAGIAELQDAAFGNRIPLDQFDTDMLADQTVTIKTAVQPANEEKGYPERTIVASRGYVKKSS